MTTGPGFPPDSQPSLLTDAQTEAIRPGATRAWNPAAARRYLTGLGGGRWHAVPRARARSARRWARTPGQPLEAIAACRAPVLVAARRGIYDRVSAAVTQRPCRMCAWQLAIETGSTGRELALITPSRAEAADIARSGTDPMLAVRVCLAILRSACDSGDEDGDFPGGLDSPAAAQLLALAARHRPVLYVGGSCAEGDCETCPAGEVSGSAAECSYPCADAGCGACTPRAGSWAGEWEGTPLPGLLVPAPCSVLTVLAARYGSPCPPGLSRPGSLSPRNNPPHPTQPS
jgi:hypothetical protein